MCLNCCLKYITNSKAKDTNQTQNPDKDNKY